MAANLGVVVCPHAGGVGLCEMVQHLQVSRVCCPELKHVLQTFILNTFLIVDTHLILITFLILNTFIKLNTFIILNTFLILHLSIFHLKKNASGPT